MILSDQCLFCAIWSPTVAAIEMQSCLCGSTDPFDQCMMRYAGLQFGPADHHAVEYTIPIPRSQTASNCSIIVLTSLPTATAFVCSGQITGAPCRGGDDAEQAQCTRKRASLASAVRDEQETEDYTRRSAPHARAFAVRCGQA